MKCYDTAALSYFSFFSTTLLILLISKQDQGRGGEMIQRLKQDTDTQASLSFLILRFFYERLNIEHESAAGDSIVKAACEAVP